MRFGINEEVLDCGVSLTRVVPAEIGAVGVPWPFRYALRYLARTDDCVVMPVLESRPLDPADTDGRRGTSC